MTNAIFKTAYAVSLKQFGRWRRMAEYTNGEDARNCITRNWPNEQTKITTIRKAEFWVSNGTIKSGVLNSRSGVQTGKPFLAFQAAQRHAKRANARVASGKYSGNYGGKWEVCQYQAGACVHVVE